MKFLCLIYDDQQKLPGLTKDEYDALMTEYYVFTQRIRANGEYVSSEALQPPNTASTVRVRDGAATSSSGPYAEATAPLIGYYLVNAPDMSGAIDVAARIPTAKLGSIETRPVVDFGQG